MNDKYLQRIYRCLFSISDPGLGFGLGAGGSLLAQNFMGGPCRFKRDDPERVEKRFYNTGGPMPCPYPPQFPPGFGANYPPGLGANYPPGLGANYPPGFGANFPPGPVPFGGGYPNLYPGPSPMNQLNAFGPIGAMGPYPGGYLPVPGYGFRSLDNAKSPGPVNKRLGSTETDNAAPNTSLD